MSIAVMISLPVASMPICPVSRTDIAACCREYPGARWQIARFRYVGGSPHPNDLDRHLQQAVCSEVCLADGIMIAVQHALLGSETVALPSSFRKAFEVLRDLAWPKFSGECPAHHLLRRGEPS